MNPCVPRHAAADAAVVRGLQRVVAAARRVEITLAICLLATLVLLFDAGASLFTFDRQAILDGQWWRLVTGHFVHWNFEHYFFDVLMFATLGSICERKSRWSFAGCLVASILAISAAIWWAAPDTSYCRGLSGIDSAIFTLAAGMLVHDAWKRRDGVMVSAIAVCLLGFAAKVVYEVATGRTIFVDSASAGFTPLPLTHAVGAVVGIAVCGLSNVVLTLRVRRSCEQS